MADSTRIRVVCRVRPLNAKEKEHSEGVVKFPNPSSVELTVGFVYKIKTLLLDIITFTEYMYIASNSNFVPFDSISISTI